MKEAEALIRLREIVADVRAAIKSPQDMAVVLTNFDSKILSSKTDIPLDRKNEINRQINILYNIITIRLESQKLIDFRKSKRINEVKGISATQEGILQA